MKRQSITGALLLTLAIAQVSAMAQEVNRRSLPNDHPLVGAWKFQLSGDNCFEIYDLHANGTSSITSGTAIVESEFEIPVNSSRQGFYKWVDKITKHNGKPDCMGSVIEVGHVATTYIALHRLGKMFLVCADEDLNTCIGPFVRQDGT